MAWTDPSLTNVPIKAVHITELRDKCDNLENNIGQLNNRIWDVVIEDQKPSGTDGGTFSSGAWITRDLNTLVYNHDSLASLSNNQFTLPAGTYCIDWDAPAFSVDDHQARLVNSNTSNIVAYGTPEHASYEYWGFSRSRGTFIITINDYTTFEIQHRCSRSRPDIGFGRAFNFGAFNFGTEIYTRVRIKKMS